MCGIAGYVHSSGSGAADRDIVERMCRTILHRGPDDQGVYVDGPVAIDMRRLSVIDLNTGHQPISNESQTIWVVLNGEIYNYRELAVWLKSRGHRFHTSSDTEVIVHLYEELGEDCVHKLRGMFAFAVWDELAGRLFIARDRLGVKPLYYCWDGKQLVFGSELKAVLAHPAVERQPDIEGLLYYLQYSYVPEPLTAFKGIAKLPPGHTLSVVGPTLRIQSYWDGATPAVEGDGSAMSEEDALAELGKHLQDSVRLRLISDVPLGAFLSGGIDSSLVVALMARQMSRPVKTFSIGFAEEAYNELPYARRVAQYLSTEHHELIVGPEECDLIERVVSHFDEPFGDPSAIPTYHLSRLASQHVTVSLSGDGGDELFGGYERYRIDLSRSRFDALPGTARNVLGLASDVLPIGFYGKRFLHNVSLKAGPRYLDNISYFSRLYFPSLLTPQIYDERSKTGDTDVIMEKHFKAVAGRPWLSQLLYVDTKTYLPGDILTKVDRMSMAHSLEAREPLLDHVLVEFAAKLAPEMKIRNGVSKYLLKRFAEKVLPHEIVYRKKQGFGVPLEYWFKGSLREYVHDVLFDSRARARGIFQPRAIEALVRRYELGQVELANAIWILIVLETWFRLYLDDKGGSTWLPAWSTLGKKAN